MPLVIPLLFYTGQRSPYPYSTRWLEEFDDPALAAQLYGNAFPLVDITTIPDDEIMQHKRIAALTLLQKHIHQRDMAELLDRLARLLVSEPITGQQLVSLINYLAQAGETADAPAFVRKLAQRMPQHKDKLMTIAQQLEQIGLQKGLEQGLEQGIEQGIQLGKQQGKQEATLKIARNMLQAGIDHRTIMTMTGLSAEQLAQLRH